VGNCDFVRFYPYKKNICIRLQFYLIKKFVSPVTVNWVDRVLGLQVEWNEFYLVNAFVIILGVSCAAIGWRRPEMALSFPSFMLVNAILFHIVPVLITHHFSPGLFTAVVLFLPIAGWAYYGAWADEVLTARTGVVSGVFGFLMMMFPIVLQIPKRLPFFYQGGG